MTTSDHLAAPDWINGTPADLRAWRNARPEVTAPILPPGLGITPVAAGFGCQGGLLFTPACVTAPDIVYFHGGGFVVGSPETHRIVAGWLAHRADARVFSVRYRLAPENVLSAQAQDAAGALRRWPGASLRIAGDSAGALVALWGHAALTAPERQRITSALLIYGAFGLWIPPGPDDPAHEADGLGPRAVAAMYARLDPGHLMPGHPALDPFSPDFALPRKLCLLAAGTDPLLQDSHALAAHATAQGYDTQWILAENLGHGFLSALPDPAAMQPFAKAVQCLSR